MFNWLFDWLFTPITRTDDWYGREYTTSRWEIFWIRWIPRIVIMALCAIAIVMFVLTTTGC